MEKNHHSLRLKFAKNLRGQSAPAQPGSRSQSAGTMRGQSAVEAFVMIAVALAFLVPLGLLFLSNSQDKMASVSVLQARSLVREMADISSSVCYQGYLAKKVAVLSYPDRLLNLTLNGTEILARVDSGNGNTIDIVAQSPCNLTNSINSNGYFISSRSISSVRQGRFIGAGLMPLVFLNYNSNITIYRAVNRVYGIG